ncbi:hypothetical protein JL100_001260 [Skermanella mucosa]|uniref:hypothetical protein n=1 Tax=Skermanella mucosa TaxID=1789672 RepID=UPI00192B6507|nr:hypothetical protein [Skermanella mucosa]UEM21436.1 hypothetical protein JL100_001260 [Skermanella mucosa]
MRTGPLAPTIMTRESVMARSPFAPLALALGVQIVMIALITRLVGVHAWDDGAITLAFSRTFAESGLIALTPVSEQVEGYSSTAWFLINAVIALFRPGFEGAIHASQVAAGICLGIATVFVWLIARDLGLRSRTTLAILLVFSLFGPAVSEVSNGMEMTLLTAAGLALYHALYVRENRLLLAVAIVVFLTVRFEAMIYYAALLTPLLFRGRYRSFVLLAAAGMAVVALHETARYMVFGDIFPNPVHAKMHVPYSLSGLQGVKLRLIAAVEITATLLPLVLAVSALLLVPWNRLSDRLSALGAVRNDVLALAAPVAAVVLFAVLIGKNWGYVGRMQFLALPFVLLIFGLVYDRLAESARAASARPLLVAVCAVTVLFSWVVSARQPIAQMARTLSSGGGEVAEVYGTTPETYRRTGLAVDRLRQLVGKDTITFATPDVGGLALCCDRIRVVDLGLLASRKLAKHGYGALPAILAEERPDAIEVHQHWGVNSKIYTIPEFRDNYQPVIIDRTRLYLRNEHAAKLIELRRAEWCSAEEANCAASALRTHRYATSVTKLDDLAFLERKRVLMVGDMR